MKIISHNVNGIRAVIKKGYLDWLKTENPDILCLQEIKLSETELVQPHFEEMGYQCFWHPAQKKGYSGVAILSKTKPKHVEIGCGISQFDVEGRVIRADFADFSLISAYFPSGSSGDGRQEVKFKFLDEFYVYIQNLKKTLPNLVICGDYNICHTDIDIHNPKTNQKTSGFLPEERAWMSKFLDLGFIDTFRHFDQSPHHYTWWSIRFGPSIRERNLGWRIDYHMATAAMQPRLAAAGILPSVMFSDHCPISLTLKV